jgi:hypothetical protein
MLVSELGNFEYRRVIWMGLSHTLVLEIEIQYAVRKYIRQRAIKGFGFEWIQILKNRDWIPINKDTNICFGNYFGM